MSVSASRVAIVTAALLGVGAVCGAVLGGLALVVEIHPLLPPVMATLRLAARLRIQASALFGLFGAGALFGAPVGAMLAPMVGWLFLRRVSLAQAIGQTALGALIGIAVSAVLRPDFSLPFALAGFLAAAIRLWIVARRSCVDRHSFATG
jgi:hypothetical protein